jgi:hypothetical protein
VIAYGPGNSSITESIEFGIGFCPTFQHSITPSLHHSNAPLLLLIVGFDFAAASLVSLRGFLGLVLRFLCLDIEDLSGSRVYTDFLRIFRSGFSDIDRPELRAICSMQLGSSDFASFNLVRAIRSACFSVICPCLTRTFFSCQRGH